MKKLQCELCGSVDIIRTNDGFFRCEHCGCKYTLEQVRTLLGTVETTIGTAELERLLKNAKAQYDLGQVCEAEETYKEVTKQFPNDYRGWLGLLQINYRFPYENNSLIKLYEICQKLAPSEQICMEIKRDWITFWNTLANKCLTGEKIYGGTDNYGFYENTTPDMYNYVKTGFDNARILNSLNAVYSLQKKQWVLRSRYDFPYYFWLGPYRVKDDNEREGWRSKILPPLDDSYIAEIKSDIQKYISDCLASGNCPLCGRRVKRSLFGTKCQYCSKKF